MLAAQNTTSRPIMFINIPVVIFFNKKRVELKNNRQGLSIVFLGKEVYVPQCLDLLKSKSEFIEGKYFFCDFS